ncbi:MAG: ACT domain-containing protein [Actinomycetes bacterium]|jgi:glycine cleavage system transcriptional repressor
MSSFAVTILGQDRPGIIAEATGALADLGGNLEDTSMTLLRGHFVMTLVVSTDATEQSLRAILDEKFGDKDLDVVVMELHGAASAPSAGQSYVLSVHGADRVGIVASITEVLARGGANITDLTTRLGGSLYLLVAEIDIPASTSVAELEAQIKQVAEDLGVGASLRPAESDDL